MIAVIVWLIDCGLTVIVKVCEVDRIVSWSV